MTHNEEHLENCKARLIEAVADWRREHPGQPFTIHQVVADITEDQRSIYIMAHSEEGAEIYLRNTFDEVLFDYDAFSRRDWSRALRTALQESLA